MAILKNLVYAQGNKMNNVDVVYTLWSNLRKTPGMDVGQVGFHNEKEVSFLLYLVNLAQYFKITMNFNLDNKYLNS